MNQAQLQDLLDSALRTHQGVGASLCVYQDGQILSVVSGLANDDSGVEMTQDTLLHIGSITKIFNTTLLMQLVDEGRVSLDDPVSKHLPELELGCPEALEAITLKMLVNHSSGIDGEVVPEQGHDQETIADAIPRFADMGQVHAPGEDCSYCNTATVIAGYLCQKLTGVSWYDLVKQRIFSPLEMRHAAVLPEDALLWRSSVGHFLNPETGQNTRTSFAFLPLSFAPAGATAMMSAEALVTFARMHLGNGLGANGERVFSEESAKAMRAKTIDYRGPVGFGEGVGLGWIIGGNGSVNHGGGGPGILSWLIVCPQHDFAAAMLTNVAHGMTIIQDVMRPILSNLGLVPWGEEAKQLFDQPEVKIEDPSMVTGRWENCAFLHEISHADKAFQMRSKLKVKFYDGMEIGWSPPAPIKFVAQDTFISGDPADIMSGAFSLVNPEATSGKPRHLAGGGRLYLRSEDL